MTDEVNAYEVEAKLAQELCQAMIDIDNAAGKQKASAIENYQLKRYKAEKDLAAKKVEEPVVA